MAAGLDRFDRRLREQGFRLIAGVDEAGRGAWAGPMFAAAVILPESFDLDGIDDSKALTAKQREACFDRIMSEATAIAVCRATPTRRDRRGPHQSNPSLVRPA